jgi:sugar lactone lactonase YvrE
MRRLLSIACATALVVAFSMPVVAPAGRVSAASPPTYLEQVLVKGATIHGANGLAIDGGGRLLVASVWGQQITAVDRSTGRVLQRYGPIVDGTQLGTPDDVAAGPDGSIYYTDIMGGMVGRITPDGHLTKQPVAAFNNPLAFDAVGRLFVAQALLGDCLYRVDPALVAPPVKILCGSGAAGFPEQLNGFDFGPDGKLYAPQPALGRVVRIDVDATPPTVTVVASDLGGNPASVEFDARGNLYANLGQGPVVRINPATGAVTAVTTLPWGLDNMAIDGRGRLFVSNSDDGHVDRVNPATGTHRQVLKGGQIIPGGVAVLPQATGGDWVVVADLWRVATYNGRTGRLLDLDKSFGAFGPIPGVTTTAADGGRVLLTSWIAGVVTEWNSATDAPVAVHAGFGLPLNAIRFGGDLVVAALGPAPVVRQASDGTRTPLAAGSVFVPTGLAATTDDLWVADWATGVVWQLVKDGTTLPSPVAVAGGLVQPEGLAVDLDGSLLVVEAGAGRLTRIQPGTGATSTVASGLRLGAAPPPGAPPTWIFNGVAVGGRGDVYVTGDVSGALYRFSPVP